MMGLPDGEKSVTFTHFERMYERDRQTHTDRQTDTTSRQRPHLMQASRDKNCGTDFLNFDFESFRRILHFKFGLRLWNSSSRAV